MHFQMQVMSQHQINFNRKFKAYMLHQKSSWGFIACICNEKHTAEKGGVQIFTQVIEKSEIKVLGFALSSKGVGHKDQVKLRPHFSPDSICHPVRPQGPHHTQSLE